MKRRHVLPGPVRFVRSVTGSAFKARLDRVLRFCFDLELGVEQRIAVFRRLARFQSLFGMYFLLYGFPQIVNGFDFIGFFLYRPSMLA